MDCPPDKILDFLRSDGKVLVVTHSSPDGDAIGSLIAFSGMLEQLGVAHVTAVDDVCPDRYSFLPGFEGIRSLRERPLNGLFHRLVVLDAGDIARIGSARERIGPDTKILNIDHHFTSGRCGDLNLVDVKASATAEILYDLCLELGVKIDQRIAYGLYVGILTDTGRFRFGNSSARAFKICSDLIERGVNPGWVAENVYFNHPVELVRALAKAISTLELHFGGLVCLIELGQGYCVDDTEGFVEYASSIKGVALAAFVCEVERGVYKASLRSRCAADVSAIAGGFGGGGHRKAAGFRHKGDKGEMLKRLLGELKRQIEIHGLKPGERFVEAVDEQRAALEWLVEWANHK